jgi:hypothetical protein
MDATQRAAWVAANPALWARLLKFLAWLMKQIGVKSDYATMLKSIPPRASIPSAPPVTYPGTVPVPAYS